jgi:hypothetical protein
MHRLFAPVLAPLLEGLEPHAIAEIGAGAGQLTRKLLEAPGAREATIHAVDPSPALDPALLEEHGERLRLHRDRAIAAIGRIGAVDLAILDGDPNWHSVHSALTMFAEASRRAGGPAPLFAVHHIHWPFGRRDGYYDPAAIPPAHLHRHTDRGLVPGWAEPVEEGLRLTPYCAVREFEPRSGVLTAVEDAIAEAVGLDWTVVDVPGFHGCALLAEAELLRQRPAVAKVLAEMRGGGFLGRQARRAESARLALEVELAAGAPAPSPGPVPQPPPPAEEDQEAIAEQRQPEPVPPPLELRGRLAEQVARREALEWRLERLDEDLAARDARLAAVEKERDQARAALVEASVRLETATEELSGQREVGGKLDARVAELEKLAEAKGRELAEAVDREQLAQGRLSHREEALQAVSAEVERLRGEKEGLEVLLGEARALLDEVSEQLEVASSTRRARFSRALRRAGRTLTFRDPGDVGDPYDRARAAAARALPAPVPPPEEAAEGTRSSLLHK